LAPGSAVWLVGDSTLHPFTSRTTTVNLTSQVAAPPSTSALASTQIVNAILEHGALQQFDLSISVQSLKSKESGLDKNMYKTLDADHYPTIDFQMARYDVTRSTSNTTAWSVRANGRLRISGKEQPVTIEGTLSRDSDILRLEGLYSLLMTDYGIKPPTMMMGTIKVKNPVVIHFDLRMKV
jgi:polyisoprenoid-binding protein YceI